MSLVTQVATWSDRIQDGRQPSKILLHMNGEMVELWDEFFEVGDGEDGMYGETVDVILCALDLLRILRPELTHAEFEKELTAYAAKKCLKWYNNVIKKEVLTSKP